MEDFLADPGRPVRERAELPARTVAGCRFGVNARGLCSRHYDRWGRAGRPDLATWDAPTLPPAAAAECGLAFCRLWTESPEKVFCKQHDGRWTAAGRPPVERFVVDCELSGTAAIDLRELPAQLTLEFQYGLQGRADAPAARPVLAT